MKVFLIVLAVLFVLIAALLSLSATFTVIYDKGWKTKVKVLWIEKDIVLSEILSFVMFPDKKAKEKSEEKAEEKPKETAAEQPTEVKEEPEKPEKKPKADEQSKPAKPKKQNPLHKLWNEEGLLGILSLVSNLAETANSAILTLIRGLHIYSLYVMIIVGGGDAEEIGISYGRLCSYYYPVKGLILNTMKVDNYDDYIQPDFIAPRTEFEFQFIGSISVGLLLKVALKAGFIFVKNLIKNKKGDKGYERNSDK